MYRSFLFIFFLFILNSHTSYSPKFPISNHPGEFIINASINRSSQSGSPRAQTEKKILSRNNKPKKSFFLTEHEQKKTIWRKICKKIKDYFNSCNFFRSNQ